MLLDPKITGKNFGKDIKKNNTSSTTNNNQFDFESSDASPYIGYAKAGVDILGDLFYDTNNYALNFDYKPVLPGIGNRDAILNNNVHFDYQSLDNVGVGEYLSDAASAVASTGQWWMAIPSLLGNFVKSNKINQENLLGYALVKNANDMLNAINNYSLEQTDKYNTFMQLRHMAEGGGNLNTHGATFDNGMTYFNVGGTHGLNPYGGVLQGFNQEDGQPNLVEQGETKWNDYIFSNRYKAGGSLLKKYLLPEDYAGMTFADISKKLSEPLEDTPGSAIEKRTTDTMLSRLMEAQEDKRQKDNMNKLNSYIYAKGGRKKRTPIDLIDANPRTINLLDNPYNQYDIIDNPPDVLPRTLVSQYIEPYDNTDGFIGPETEEEWLYRHPLKTKRLFNPRNLTLVDNLFSVLSDKLGWTNLPDYGRSRMYRDAMSNIRDVNTPTPYIQRYLPKHIPIQSLMNNYRSMHAADLARINNTTNSNIIAAQALANDATNKYYDSIGKSMMEAVQYNNQEDARSTQLNNIAGLQLAQLLLNDNQINAQQGNRRYEANKDYINDLSIQGALASAAQQKNLDTWREGYQNKFIEDEDKNVIAQLIASGALRYDPNTGAYYLDNGFLQQYV